MFFLYQAAEPDLQAGPFEVEVLSSGFSKVVDSSAYQSYEIDDLNINPYLRSQQSSDSSIL